MAKSLANNFYVKKTFYTLSIEEGSSFMQHIHNFNKVIIDIKAIDVNIEDENNAIILLNSLSYSYKHFMNTLLYGKQSLITEDFKSTLNSKKYRKKSKGTLCLEEGLAITRGRFEKKGLDKELQQN